MHTHLASGRSWVWSPVPKEGTQMKDWGIDPLTRLSKTQGNELPAWILPNVSVQCWRSKSFWLNWLSPAYFLETYSTHYSWRTDYKSILAKTESPPANWSICFFLLFCARTVCAFGSPRREWAVPLQLLLVTCRGSGDQETRCLGARTMDKVGKPCHFPCSSLGVLRTLGN